MQIIKEYQKDGYNVTEYDNGTISKVLIPEPTEPIESTPQATQLDRIEAQTAYIAMMIE